MMSLPVIDISPLCKDINANVDSAEVRQTVEQVHNACRDYGFFYISGHGLDQTNLEEMLEAARKFFALPLEEKIAVSMQNNRSFRGYVETNSEQTDKGQDQRESMYFLSEINPDNSDGWTVSPADKEIMACPNQFPAENDVPGFEETINNFSNRLEELGAIMMKAVAQGLQLTDKDEFHQKFYPPMTTLILLHYPTPNQPEPDETKKWGIGPHTDYGLFIFLLQDEVGGLEVELREGEWIDVKPIPGTLIVNLGDCLEGWTKGLYRATKHRVRRSTKRDRYSIAFFYDPKPGCIIEPLNIEMTKDLTFNKKIKGFQMPFRFWEYFKSLNQINYYWKKTAQIISNA